MYVALVMRKLERMAERCSQKTLRNNTYTSQNCIVAPKHVLICIRSVTHHLYVNGVKVGQVLKRKNSILYRVGMYYIFLCISIRFGLIKELLNIRLDIGKIIILHHTYHQYSHIITYFTLFRQDIHKHIDISIIEISTIRKIYENHFMHVNIM